MLHQQRGAAVDHARVPVVGAHPVGGIGSASRFKADGVGRGFVLRLPVERVVVAAVAEVQKTSRRGQKIEGGLGIAAGALEDSAALPGPLLGFLQVEQKREPDGQVIVAQAARTLLQVRLEMEDGVAVLGVAGAGNFAQLLRDGVPLAQNQAGKDGLVQLLVERELSGQKATVERGEREFEVVGVEASGFLHRPRTGAGPQADVPHALNDCSDGFFGLLLGLLIGEGEQHVDVGVGEQILASVAAQGQQRDVLRGLPGKGSAPHFNEDTVDDSRSPPDRSGAVSGPLTGLADKRHLPEILIP